MAVCPHNCPRAANLGPWAIRGFRSMLAGRAYVVHNGVYALREPERSKSMRCDQCGAEARVRHKLIIPRVESDPWDNLFIVPNSAHYFLWVSGRCSAGTPSRAAESSNSRAAKDPYCPHCGWNDVRCHCDGL